MANQIRLKRGSGSSPGTSDLVVGEVAVRTDTGQLFTKKDDGNIEEIGAQSGIADGSITNAKVNASAAIAGTKISPNFGTQNIVTTGTLDVGLSTLNRADITVVTDGSRNNGVFLEPGDTGQGNRPKLRLKGAGNAGLAADAIQVFHDNGSTKVFQLDYQGNIEARDLDVRHADFSAGIDVTGTITATGTITSTGLIMADNKSILLGDSDDFRIRHTGSHSEITDEGTGHLRLGGSQKVDIGNASFSKLYFRGSDGGGVGLYHNGTLKFGTSSAGINVYGSISVTGTVDGVDIAALNTTVGTKLPLAGGTLTGNLELSSTYPSLTFTDTNHNSDYRITNNDGQLIIYDNTNGAHRLNVNADGHIDILGNLDVGAGLDVTGNSTFAGNLTVSGTVPHIDLNDTDNESDYRIRNVNGTFQILDIDQAGGTVFFQRETNTDVTVTGNFNVTNGVDVTGNITVTGTVDGRDVATDGTKLDGIESGATADQTASEILTLIKTVDGNGSGLDADLLDGVSQASFLRSDTTDTATGAITFTNSHLQLSGHHYQGYHSSAQNYIHFYPQDPSNNAGSSAVTTDIRAWNGSSFDTLRIIGGNNTITWRNNTIFHSGNDGSGSGLDADLLDGQQGSYYRNASNINAGTVAAARLSTATTQSAGNNTTKIATTAFVSTAINNLINGAPAALDTLNELAAAMNDNASFSTTVTNSLATKMPLAGGQFTGNITFSGSQTVDGRDLSVDGAKLDTIESNATADQTASEILTLIKTVDGAGSGLDADTLDGRNSSSSASNNTVVLRNASGYIFSNFINTTDNSQTHSIGGLICKNTSDDYHRTATAGAVRTFLNVENGATADQTASEILTLIKTVDGLGSGLDADSVDGIAGSSFLRSDQADTMSGNLSLHGNLLLTGTATTTNQSRMIDFTGFDKESTSDFSDRAYIQHTVNTGGFAGSVLVISSRNDANDGIALDTNGNNGVKINSNVVWNAGNDGSGSGLDSDLLDGQHGSYYSNYNNLSNKPTIPTNNNQLTNGAGYITSADGGNATLLDGIDSGQFLRSDASDSFSGTLTNNSRNENPTVSNGAINLQPSTSGGRTGIVFRSRVNSTSDHAYVWWYDDLDTYRTSGNSSENGVLLLGIQNDAANATSSDTIAIESSGDIFLNPGIGTGVRGSNSHNSSLGNLYVGNAATKYKVIHTNNLTEISGQIGSKVGLGTSTGGTPGSRAAFLALGDNDTGVAQNGDGQLELWANNQEIMNLDTSNITAYKHILPSSTNAYNLGSNSNRWNNLYVNDMHFSNEGKTNDVDGSWGDWTLQEGEEDIFMINNRSGKKFKIAMVPV